MNKWSVPADQGRFRLVNLITTSRIPVSIAFVILIQFAQIKTWPITVILLVMLTCIEVSDGLDGHLARTWGVQSEWGAMLDPFSDSMSRLIVYFGLSQVLLVHPIIVLIMALRDVTVAYCRILLTQAGESVAAKLSGKIKAVVQGVGAYAAVLSVWVPNSNADGGSLMMSGWIITAVVGIVTLWSIGDYARAALRAARPPGDA